MRIFLHVTISHNYLHQYNYPMVSRRWWPAVPQHYSYSSPAGQKIAAWAEEVLLKDNKGYVQKGTILSRVLREGQDGGILCIVGQKHGDK